MSNIQKPWLHNNENLATIFKVIKTIKDYRRFPTHPLESVLMIAICAMIGGANNNVAIQNFGDNHAEWFRAFLSLPGGIPRHDTFNRMLLNLPTDEMSKIMDIVHQIGSSTSNESSEKQIQEDDSSVRDALKKQITVDAKALRALERRSIVRAYSKNQLVTLAQRHIPHETNEITIVPKVLNSLPIRGAIITADAINTQKNIVKIIAENDAYYLFPVKKNHPQLFDDLSLYLDDLSDNKFPDLAYDYHQTLQSGHGRIEKRECWVTKNVRWLYRKSRWSNLKSIAVIKTTVSKGNEITITKRYYITNLSSDAKVILALIQNHWSIENNLHWPLNVSFDEHKSTIRKGNGAQNFALLRNCSLSLLQKNCARMSVNEKRARAAHQFSYLLQVLTGKSIDTRTLSSKIVDFTTNTTHRFKYFLCDFLLRFMLFV